MSVKTFQELDENEKQAALDQCRGELLEDIVSGAIRFNDELNHDDLQRRIDAAAEDMERNRTPWFLAERLLEDEYIREMVDGMAQCDAEEALYPMGNTRIVDIRGGVR